MKTVLALLAVCLCAFAVGCADQNSTAQPAPAQETLTGPAARLYPRAIADTESVTDAVLKSMSLVITDRQGTPAGRYIEARRPDGTSVFIHLVKRDQGTEVRIRVGLFGDPDYAAGILDAISARLK